MHRFERFSMDSVEVRSRQLVPNRLYREVAVGRSLGPQMRCAINDIRQRCVSAEGNAKILLPKLPKEGNHAMNTIECLPKQQKSRIPRRVLPVHPQSAPLPVTSSPSSSSKKSPSLRRDRDPSPLNNQVVAPVVDAVVEQIPDDPPIPRRPHIAPDTPIYPEGFQIIQDYINAFGYNHTSVPFYHMKKTGGTLHVLHIVEQICTLAMPIQCVEAVFIGAVLSRVWSSVDRIPISFKSKFEQSSHRHIVLALHCNGKWGSLGISRRSCLMDKPMLYDSLWDLIEDFRSSYQSVFHKLLSVYIGLPIPHNFKVDQPLAWKAIKLRMELSEASENQQEVNKFLQSFIRHYKVAKP